MSENGHKETGDNKREEITVKGISIQEHDYRGFLAFALVIGEIILLGKGDHQAAAVLGPLVGAAVGWYFTKRGGG